MIQITNITRYFSLTVDDIKSIDTLRNKKAELLLEIEINDEDSIKVGDKEFDKNSITKLFDDLKSYREIYTTIMMVDGLLDFLSEGVFDNLDYDELANIDNNAKILISPIMNNKYSEIADKLISGYSAITEEYQLMLPYEIENLQSCFDFNYFEESKIRIDQIWNNQLKSKVHLFSNNAVSIGQFIDSFVENQHYLDCEKQTLICLMTKPHLDSLQTFKNIITNIINTSIRVTKGDYAVYSQKALNKLLDLIYYLTYNDFTPEPNYEEHYYQTKGVIVSKKLNYFKKVFFILLIIIMLITFIIDS